MEDLQASDRCVCNVVIGCLLMHYYTKLLKERTIPFDLFVEPEVKIITAGSFTLFPEFQ